MISSKTSSFTECWGKKSCLIERASTKQQRWGEKQEGLISITYVCRYVFEIRVKPCSHLTESALCCQPTEVIRLMCVLAGSVWIPNECSYCTVPSKHGQVPDNASLSAWKLIMASQTVFSSPAENVCFFSSLTLFNILKHCGVERYIKQGLEFWKNDLGLTSLSWCEYWDLSLAQQRLVSIFFHRAESTGFMDWFWGQPVKFWGKDFNMFKLSC